MSQLQRQVARLENDRTDHHLPSPDALDYSSASPAIPADGPSPCDSKARDRALLELVSVPNYERDSAQPEFLPFTDAS